MIRPASSSENISIGEILLVCRSWKNAGPKPPTRVVNLARNPATPLEAQDTAVRIGRVGEAGGQVSHEFTIQEVDFGRIERGDWFAVNFLSTYLVETQERSVHPTTDAESIPIYLDTDDNLT